jgi:hypothetical protein
VDFLATHPREVIIFDLEDYAPPSTIAQAFEESGLLAYVYRSPLGPSWPTLGEIIASGGRVIVFMDYDDGGVPWMHRAWNGLMAETPGTVHAPEEFSCKPMRGTPTGDLFMLNNWIETTPAPRPSNAEIVNQRDFLLERARLCERERGMKVNMVVVDFAGIGDVVGAVRVLNGLAAD